MCIVWTRSTYATGVNWSVTETAVNAGAWFSSDHNDPGIEFAHFMRITVPVGGRFASGSNANFAALTKASILPIY